MERRKMECWRVGGVGLGWNGQLLGGAVTHVVPELAVVDVACAPREVASAEYGDV